MRRIWEVLKNWAWPAVARALVVEGFKTDGPAINLYSLAQAANNQVENPVAITTIVAQVLSALNMLQGVVRFTGALGGPINVTTDTAIAIIAALGAQTPLDGSYGELVRIVNDNGGQTITLVGGTGVTINGTATIATNTCRTFALTVTAAGAVTLQNLGTQNL